jgi:hypothetical protein
MERISSFETDAEVRKVLEPLFSKHHANLVISGHDHLYERSKPISLLKSRKAPVGSYKEGTCYVVSGGAVRCQARQLVDRSAEDQGPPLLPNQGQRIEIHDPRGC